MAPRFNVVNMCPFLCLFIGVGNFLWTCRHCTPTLVNCKPQQIVARKSPSRIKKNEKEKKKEKEKNTLPFLKLQTAIVHLLEMLPK